jgi:hypothetical protein
MMRMHTRLLGAAMGAYLLATATGCAGEQHVTVDYSPATQFSQYRTFALVSRPDSASHQLIDDRVREAVAAQLEAKGLTEVDRSHADLFVGYGVVDRTRHEDVGPEWGWGPAWGWESYQWGVAWPVNVEERIETYTDGTVVMHFVDAKTHRRVWQGRAADVLRLPVADPAEATRRIDAAVAKMLAQYPPHPAA